MNYTLNNRRPSWIVIVWLIILACLMAWNIAKGQDRKELPILNQKILYYVDSVENTHVGKGLCRHFVMGAVNYALGENVLRERWYRKLEPADFLCWEGYNLPPEQALPGDVIYISAHPSHTGIIYKISNDRCFTIAHQVRKVKKTKVIIENYCREKFQDIKYLRLIKTY